VYPVRLTGSHVVLREFRETDLDALVAIVGNEQVTDWLSFDRRSRAEADEMLKGIIERSEHSPREEYYLAIGVRPHETVVGLCRLALSGVRAAKLGFAVRPDHWSQGLATNSASTMIQFGFEVLRLHRITAAIGPTNEASIAIAKRLGMHYEGRLRDHVFTNGAWRDSLLFSVLAEEWSREHGLEDG
jgi:ribosomal-protein-alanine N-acetyltransferase